MNNTKQSLKIVNSQYFIIFITVRQVQQKLGILILFVEIFRLQLLRLFLENMNSIFRFAKLKQNKCILGVYNPFEYFVDIIFKNLLYLKQKTKHYLDKYNVCKH